MDRLTKEYLAGFQRAALLVERILSTPPCFMSAQSYLEDVADLHLRAGDLRRRGIAVGCLSALGR